MGLFNKLFSRREETRGIPSTPDIGIFSGGGYSDAGVTVNEMIAMTTSAVYACVSVIANSIATLPVHVLARKDGAKQYEHPLQHLLAVEPNEYQTSPAWRETMLVQLLLYGNSYCYIERGPGGVPTALLPLRSDVTRPVREANGLFIYETRIGNVKFKLTPDEVLHFSNISIDGVTGLSPIMQAKQSIGLSLGLERFAAKFFGQGCHTGGVLTVPSLKSEGMKSFAQKFREKYTGTDNAWKVPVLEAGMTYTPTVVDPEKSQALGQRVHQLREVARIFRVPCHKIGDLDRATFSNIEHQSLEFVQDCLMPWVVKIEAECNRKLLLEREKGEFEVKLNLDSLLRADTASRFAAHAVAINAGFKSVNEVRVLEGLPPVAGGDVLRWPLNTAPVGQPAPTPDPVTPATPALPAPDPSATRGMIEATAKRFVTKELRAIERAGKKYLGKPEEFRTWAGQFYKDHAALVTESLAPALKAAGSSVAADEYAKRHCNAGLALITRALAEQWTSGDITNELNDRPAQVADELLNGGFENAAA